jgi:chromosomal replication initiator protein
MFLAPSQFYNDDHPLKRKGIVPIYPQFGALINMKQIEAPSMDAILTLHEFMDADKVPMYVIRDACCAYFNVTKDEFLGKLKTKRIARCRMTFYWLANDLNRTNRSEIGRHSGGRDHSTVLSGIRKMERLKRTFGPAIATLKGELKP